VTVCRLLFEGLYYHDRDHRLAPALAESVEISSDQKQYTFTLKGVEWSNGDPVTSSDFAYSWKTVLSPVFLAPNAYQMFMIKGAREAKRGVLSLDQVGIATPDPKTLVVELESPTPYFLEILTSQVFFPVHQGWDRAHPGWEKENLEKMPISGPYRVRSWKPYYSLSFERNPRFWGNGTITVKKNHTRVDELVVDHLDPNTSLQLFLAGELDWTGSPLSIIPPELVPVLRQRGKLLRAPVAGIHWLRLNCNQPPFHHPKMRRAFALALNRQEIVDHVLQGGEIPAMGLIPPSLLDGTKNYFADHDLEGAKRLFEEALEEMGMTREQIPSIRLSYTPIAKIHKIVQTVQQQWKQAFGVSVTLDKMEGAAYFERIRGGKYHVSSGSWFADFRDPISFLEVFKFKANSTNNTGWENHSYQELLDQSDWEGDPQKRRALLTDAEAILLDEMPIVPLFFYVLNAVKQEWIDGVYFSDLGYFDFREATRLRQ